MENNNYVLSYNDMLSSACDYLPLNNHFSLFYDPDKLIQVYFNEIKNFTVFNNMYDKDYYGIDDEKYKFLLTKHIFIPSKKTIFY